LILSTRRGPQAGRLSVSVDQKPAQTFDLSAAADEPGVKLAVASSLPDGQHQVSITNLSGRNVIDGFIVRRAPDLTWALLIGLLAALGITYVIIRQRLP
jgi:hypothetical protein